MSNIIAGDIFQKIIDEVVTASQTDFEENGVNQQTLVEMQQTWQQKLSVRSVAQMPWDPKPAPPQPISQSAASSQGGTPVQAYPSSQNLLQSDGQVHVKREPGTDASYNGVAAPGPNYTPQAMNPQVAQQRAAALMQQQFGSQANASLGAMQQRGIALPGQQSGQQKPPSNLPLPGQNQNQGPNQQAMQQQYAQQMKQQTAAQQPRIKLEEGQSESQQFLQQQQARPNVAYAQTDGAGDAMEDWTQMIAKTNSLSNDQISKNDRLVREQVLQSSRELDNGLMMPLRQQRRGKPYRRMPTAHQPMAIAGVQNRHLAPIPQLDGDFDDDDDEKGGIKDEDDENAINSDLDDDDEDNANADEDDDDIDSMLCTYDKVQRVKNKWKCTLKDGVLSANGKEYLFHKAQGEFEW